MGRDINDNMPTQSKLELIKWLLGRTDSLRNSYGSRAAIVISANAIILACIIVFIDKRLGAANFLVIPLVVLSLVLSTVSVVLAIMATANLRRNARTGTGYNGPIRQFLSPADMFANNTSFEPFRDSFNKLSEEEMVQSATAELYICLRFQGMRYAWLKASIKFLLAAFCALALSLLIVTMMS